MMLLIKGTDYIVIGRPIMNSKNPKEEIFKYNKKIRYMIPFIKICGIKKI